MKYFLALLVGLLLAFPLASPSQAGALDKESELRVVSPQGPYASIQAALDEASPGDTIEVRGGNYAGPLVIDKPVTLQGVGWPVIDGGGQGTVVRLAAPGVTLRGFEIRNSGTEPDRDHAGIAVEAENSTVEGNRLSEVLFGIFLAEAHGSVVRDNDITSMSSFDLARKGDAIRVWYSNDVVVENNRVERARDVVAWYSNQVTLRNNQIENGRYGIHLMYCDGAAILDNRVLNNSVGIYTMYSKGVDLQGNLVRGQRGPSGYALGFKDADAVHARDNLLVDNHAGVYMDGTPYTPTSQAHFEENVIAYNDIGVILLTSERGASFENNTFWENGEQVAIQGGGFTGKNEWQGNYWSDYSGFDADGDGRGEVAYQSDRFFERMTDRYPQLRLLAFSPAEQAIEFAATAFPIVKPQPKFTDPAPRSLPAILPTGAADATNPAAGPGLAIAGLCLLGLCGASLFLLRKEPF